MDKPLDNLKANTVDKLESAIQDAIKSGLDEQTLRSLVKKYPQLEDRKLSATNPNKSRAVPSFVEEAINKVCNIDPAEKKIYIGAKPGAGDIIEAVLDRKKIIEIARTLNNRVSEERLRRVLDAIINDGFDVDTIKKIAVLDASRTTTEAVTEIFSDAGIEFPTIDDAESVATVARAILRHIMTHKDSAKYSDSITPLMAWRIKERIIKGLLQTERKRVSLVGYDSTQQMDEFDENFSKTDIVLWNKDIWNAATHKSEIFIDTIVDREILDACTPMFWQFERAFELAEFFEINKHIYYCAGLVVLPHSEERIRTSFSPSQVQAAHDSGNVVELENMALKIDKALADPTLKFLRHGVSISAIFLPFEGNDPPEVRYFKPIYEGDKIDSIMLQHQVLAAMQFLTLEYVSKDDANISKKELKADRALFKQVRKGRTQIPPIKIINLRRTARKAREESEPDPNRPKKVWSCHWFVETHWHKYFHKTQNRWIRHHVLTYVKGDLTKPLKVPREKVFKAVR